MFITPALTVRPEIISSRIRKSQVTAMAIALSAIDAKGLRLAN